MKLYYLALFLLLVSCSSDSESIMEPDMGETDLIGDSAVSDVSDVSADAADLAPDVMTCGRDSDCSRGTTCHGNICAGARGCVFLSDFEPQIGCYFDHGMDYDEGLFSPTECVEESDCTNPEEPNCIARICSGLTPCAEDSECPGELTCRHNFYCK